MALIANPLFLQTGRYRALEDRYLIGAFTAPAGAGFNKAQQPRHGVLPYSRGVSAGTTDLSLMVAPSSEPNTDPGVRKFQVYRGSAVVGAKTNDGLEGAYLVVNDGNFNETLASGTAGSRFNVYLRVLDAEKDPSAPQEATAVKVRVEVVSSADPQPSELHLLLAQVTVGSTPDALTVVDKRTFTTSHGGVLLVASSTELTTDEELDLAPFGTLVHVASEGQTYVRTKGGWLQLGTLQSGSTAVMPPAAEVNTGQLWFDREKNLLFMKGSDDWLQMAGARALLKKGGEASYGSSKHRHFGNPADFRIEKATSTSFANIGSFTDVSGAAPPLVGRRPGDDDVTFYVKVLSSQTLVQATMMMDVIGAKADNAVGAVFFNAAWEIKKGSGWTTEVSEYPFGTSYTATTRYGLRWFSGQDYAKARTVSFVLDPGEYRLRPLFFLTSTDAGVPTPRALVNNFYLEVTV